MKEEFITTVQSQPPRIDVPIGRQILHKCQVTKDLESFLYQAKVWSWSALICLALSFGCLSHYLARFDGGRYADILLNGDIHQVNADKIGISRKQVKTVTYAFLYGAGDEKIGLSYDKQLSSSQAKKKGKEIRAAYVDAVDGLGDLLDAVKKASERGFIKSIDGRKIALDSPHKALNYLLQSGAGVVAKRWMVINQEHIKELETVLLSTCVRTR